MYPIWCYFWHNSLSLLSKYIFLSFLWTIQFSSVTQSCLTLCNPMECSTPGLPVHHQLPEFTQTHVHWVGDAIQPSVNNNSKETVFLVSVPYVMRGASWILYIECCVTRHCWTSILAATVAHLKVFLHSTSRMSILIWLIWRRTPRR